MYKLSLIYSIILFTCNKSTKGVTLSPCGDDQVFEVVENKSENVCFCEVNLLSDVQWYLMDGRQEVSLGTCNHNTFTCIKQQKLPVLLKVESTNVSKVIISTTDLPDKGLVWFQNTSIKCKSLMQLEASCKIDYIVEVKDVICHARYDTAIIPWRVVVTCTIGIAYSFLNRYSCQLYQEDKRAVKIGQMAAMIISQIEKHYVSGFCRMSAPISNEGRHFSYNVIISPGRKIFSAKFIGQNSTIRVPTSPPTHTCNEYIMEGVTSVCTCTGDLGVPAGNIHWNISGTSILTLQNARRTQSGTVYSCYTSWNGRYVQSVSYTLQVAFGPFSTELSGPEMPFDANGEVNATFLCKGLDVNPDPNITWFRRPSGVVINRGATYSFPPTKDDDGAVIECETKNTITSTTTRDRITVVLNYPPTSDPMISSISIPSSDDGSLYEGDSLTLTCEVSGGKPVNATVLVFTCGNKENVENNSDKKTVRSQIRIQSLSMVNQGEVCSCTTRWKSTNWYTRTSTKMLSIIYPSVILQFGFNNRTRMTINEKEVVVLTCYADGKPSPKMQIKKMSNGIVLASAPQGRLSIDDETTEVRHTFNMTRCEDTGRYVCEVDGMVREEKHAFAELYVKCAPRLLYSSEMSEMTKHVILTDSRSALSFVVAAYPLPSTPTVMFWKEIGDNFSSEATDAVQLKCQPLSELYQNNCTVTVNRELHVETGNYSVIFVNDLGRVEYRFEIQLNGNNPDILQSYPPIGAYVGGAFGAGIFLLAISVGVIVLLKHRRKQRAPEDGANNITTHALQVDNASQADVLTANEGTYSALQMAEVGQRSPYADFHIYRN